MVFDPGSQMAETLEQAQLKREADAEFLRRWEEADFEAAWKKLNQALYTRASEWEPLTIEQQETNTRHFDDIYASDIDLIMPEITDSVRDNFTGSWDLDGSIYQALMSSDVPEENREDLADAIAQYVDPRLTSIRIQENLSSQEGITVKAWMNASYINTFLGSNRHINFNSQADHLQIWDTLRMWDDATSLLRNDTNIWELNETDESIEEIAGREFNESRYTPLINAHVPETWQITDPLHDISPQQVEEISNWYLNWVDIVDAMSDILGDNHEAVNQARELDNPSTIDKRRADMYEDFSVAEEDRVDKNSSWGDTFTNLISENYTRILWAEWEVDTKASLILASQISANKIIEGKYTFTRTQEFDDAHERIQAWSESPEQMQADLMLIYTTVNNAEGVRWKSRQNEAYRQRKNSEQKALFLEAEFQNIQRLMVEQNTATKLQPWVDDIYTSLETSEKSWDVFVAGDLDTGSEAWETPRAQS